MLTVQCSPHLASFVPGYASRYPSPQASQTTSIVLLLVGMPKQPSGKQPLNLEVVGHRIADAEPTAISSRAATVSFGDIVDVLFDKDTSRIARTELGDSAKNGRVHERISLLRER